ncbi:MAG: nucleotidyltransferase family protein [Bacteroidales bacterium]|nr:nucleotidyltransferase family protein [Bacteroidales bacterium]
MVNESDLTYLFLLLRHSLSSERYTLNEIDWQAVYDLSCKLGVSALAYDGLSLGENLDIDEDLYYKWLGQSAVKENLFAQHYHALKAFSEACAKAGIKVFVLKGLAFGINYPVPNHRSCGDIDVFCVHNDGTPAYQDGNEVAHQLGAEVDTHWYKHSQIHYKGIMVENHDYLVCTREGLNYKELNKQLTKLLFTDNERRPLDDTGALVPSPYFNALFQAYHSCSHFLSEGIGLRHVLDWATFLQKEQNSIGWVRFYKDCEKYHLKRFIVAMTDIVVHKLGITVTNTSIEAHSPYADKILNSILYDDSKVFGTPGGAGNHRVRLVKNAFKYRWKFSEIAQESFLRHIIFSIWGFFFHTED